jgi:hypothetical protein
MFRCGSSGYKTRQNRKENLQLQHSVINNIKTEKENTCDNRRGEERMEVKV